MSKALLVEQKKRSDPVGHEDFAVLYVRPTSFMSFSSQIKTSCKLLEVKKLVHM